MLKVVKVHVSKATVLETVRAGVDSILIWRSRGVDRYDSGGRSVAGARGEERGWDRRLDATEVVSGSFRNISGTIASLDTAGSSFVVKDLWMKKNNGNITPDAQMAALPETMARKYLAARLKAQRPQRQWRACTQRSWERTAGSSAGFEKWAARVRWTGPRRHAANAESHAGDSFHDLKKGTRVMFVATAESFGRHGHHFADRRGAAA